MKNLNKAIETAQDATAQDATAQDATAQDATAQDATPSNEGKTPEQIKAMAILRARLPILSNNGLNFEKRTGSFFKGVQKAVVDANGEPKLDAQGNAEIKLSRVTVDEAELPTEAADEIVIKRAAAFVAAADENAKDLEKRLSEARAEVTKLESLIEKFGGILADANAAVVAFELPEKSKVPEKVKLVAKVSEMQAQNDALRAMLIAAGIDPDAK